VIKLVASRDVGPAREHPAQRQPAGFSAGGAVTPPEMSHSETQDNVADLMPWPKSWVSGDPGCFLVDKLTVVVPVICNQELQLGMTYWCDRDGQVERFTHRRFRVEGSWASSVSCEVHPGAPFDAMLLGAARECGGSLVWLRIDGNPAKWFQPSNLFGSPRVYEVAREFVRQVLHKVGIEGRICWGQCYLNRVDSTMNFDLGSVGEAASFVRQLSRFASVSHRRASGFDSSLLFPGRRSSLSIYHKGPEMRVHKPPGLTDQLLEFADRIVRFEVVSRSERLDEMHLRKLSDWRYDSPALLHRLWLSFVQRLRFPVVADLDLSRLAAPARKLFAVWLSGQDVNAFASRATVYRHRRAILDAGGPDVVLPRPTGDVVEFRRILVPVPASVPGWLAATLYDPPLAA
jgi:hypothetical protein